MLEIHVRDQARPRRARFAAIGIGLVVMLNLAPASAAAVDRVTNVANLDDGTCVRNLQIGSDKTASSSPSVVPVVGRRRSVAVQHLHRQRADRHVQLRRVRQRLHPHHGPAGGRPPRHDRQRAAAAQHLHHYALQLLGRHGRASSPVAPCLLRVQRFRRPRGWDDEVPRGQFHRDVKPPRINPALYRRRNRDRRRQGRCDRALVGVEPPALRRDVHRHCGAIPRRGQQECPVDVDRHHHRRHGTGGSPGTDPRPGLRYESCRRQRHDNHHAARDG